MLVVCDRSFHQKTHFACSLSFRCGILCVGGGRSGGGVWRTKKKTAPPPPHCFFLFPLSLPPFSPLTRSPRWPSSPTSRSRSSRWEGQAGSGRRGRGPPPIPSRRGPRALSPSASPPTPLCSSPATRVCPRAFLRGRPRGTVGGNPLPSRPSFFSSPPPPPPAGSVRPLRQGRRRHHHDQGAGHRHAVAGAEPDGGGAAGKGGAEEGRHARIGSRPRPRKQSPSPLLPLTPLSSPSPYRRWWPKWTPTGPAPSTSPSSCRSWRARRATPTRRRSCGKRSRCLTRTATASSRRPR